MARSNSDDDSAENVTKNLKIILRAGLADISALTDDLITKLKTYKDDDDEKFPGEVSKVFELLYIKSGAIEAAVSAAGELDDIVNDDDMKTAVTTFRSSLGVIAGSFRESQSIVLGKRALSDNSRRKALIASLPGLKKALADAAEEQIGED